MSQLVSETQRGVRAHAMRAKRRMGVRTATFCLLDVCRSALELMQQPWTPVLRAKALGTLLRYAMQFPSRRRRVTVKIEELADAWIAAIVGMCQAHDKDTYDAHDAKADELLGPLLAAPVKEVREFYHALTAKMKADPRVPFLVCMGFEAWGEVMVKDAPDEGVKRLKNKLAEEIAQLVQEPIRDQIPEAIKRALRWRDPETLKAVKKTLERGAKPKLRGRESCLFLEAGEGDQKVSVML